ncbi:MAG: DUF2924 domain-containing protein [Pseudomonadota bacterium]
MSRPELDALSDMSRADLVRRWQGLFRSPPPPKLSRRLLVLYIADELQWRACSISRDKLKARLKKLANTANKRPVAAQGTRLIREWNGTRHVVDVTDAGYVWQGKTWRSLSAIARRITGTQWSGPRFFGVAA